MASAEMQTDDRAATLEFVTLGAGLASYRDPRTGTSRLLQELTVAEATFFVSASPDERLAFALALRKCGRMNRRCAEEITRLQRAAQAVNE